jgi:hypothetical protein
MTRYLISGVDYQSVRVFFRTHFNPNDSVAIGDFPQGVVVVTDDDDILNLFTENGYHLVKIHDEVYTSMLLDDRGEMTGNGLALHYMNNITLH